MKLFIIQCYLYSFHARSRNFAWHLLWLSTTEGTNIVKLMGQLFSTFKFPSNFWKIAPLLGKIKNAENLRFLSLSFPSKKNHPSLQWIVYGLEEKHSRRVLRRQISAGKIGIIQLPYLPAYRPHPRIGRTPKFQWFSREKKWWGRVPG